MEQYKFNYHQLKKIQKDSKMQYNAGIISKKDYELIQEIIKNLLHGSNIEVRMNSVDDLETISSKLHHIKLELGMDLIEKIFLISDSIVRINPYYKLTKDSYKQSNKDLVVNVLNFYSNYDYNQYKYLDSIINGQTFQLEILRRNFINEQTCSSGLLILPFYNLEFIRIIKENRLYDEAAFCHELRHMIDIKNAHINSLDFSAYSEVNAISMELYYEMKNIRVYDEYKIGIKERLNQLRYIAKQLNSYMQLIVINENDKLNIETIQEIFDIKTKKELNEILLELSNDEIYTLVTYFIGTIKGIQLCSIALENKKEAIYLQDKICDVLNSHYFIPKNIEKKVSSEFNIREEDIKTYKKFIKNL